MAALAIDLGSFRQARQQAQSTADGVCDFEHARRGAYVHVRVGSAGRLHHNPLQRHLK
jgi:hypothetical protein